MAWTRSSQATVFLLILICVPRALSNVENTTVDPDEQKTLNQIYSEMNKKVKSLINENLKSILRVIGQESEKLNISAECRTNSLRLLSGLRDLRLWAVNFIDATGKLSDGFLTGNFHMFGNYDQCLNSTVLKRSGEVDFRGQYCLVSVQPYLPKVQASDLSSMEQRINKNLTELVRLYIYKSDIFRYRPDKVALCVPSGCDKNDIQQLIQYASKEMKMNSTVDYCDTEASLKYFNSTRITITCMYAIFVFLLFVGSVIDAYSKYKKIKFENPIIRSILCFSLVTNFPKFINTDVAEENLSCLNGIRVLSLLYIILGHHYLLKAESILMRNGLITFYHWIREFFFQIITNGIYTVDVFFFIGGFLNCYIRAKKNLTYFSFPTAFMALVHRLFRLYPVIIVSYVLIFMLHIRGPVAPMIESRFEAPCRTEWWKNLLFINNFYYADEQCNQQHWYLSCDMQYFIVSLVTIPLLFSKPKIGILVNSAIIVLSLLITAVRAYVNEMPPGLIYSLDIAENDLWTFNINFQSPFTHAASYFGGALFGFFLIKKKKIVIPKVAQFFGWIIASILFCTVLFMTKRWNSGTPWTRLGSALYFSLSRPLYSFSAGWMILCCVTGHGGVVNYILSLKFWIPLNRLCLTTYLISPVVQVYFFGNLRTPMDSQVEIEIWGYFGDVAISFLVSMPFVFLFESPFIALEKIIFHTEKKSSDPNENEMKDKEIHQNENGFKSDKEKHSIQI